MPRLAPPPPRAESRARFSPARRSAPPSAAEELAPLRLDAFSAGMPMTAAEFDAVQWEDVDQAYRYELLRGLLIVSPIPRPRHERTGRNVGVLLIDYQRFHPEGGHLDDALPGRYVHLPTGERRRTDYAAWCGFGREVDEDTDTPTIAVEVVSPSRRDRERDYVLKRDEYRAAGVTEYWILDPVDRSLTVVTADDERPFGPDDLYTTPLLPGFELRVRDAFTLPIRRDGGPDATPDGGDRPSPAPPT